MLKIMNEDEAEKNEEGPFYLLYTNWDHPSLTSNKQQSKTIISLSFGLHLSILYNIIRKSCSRFFSEDED